MAFRPLIDLLVFREIQEQEGLSPQVKRMLVITEKQYEAIDILLGRLTEADEPFQCEQLSIF